MATVQDWVTWSSCVWHDAAAPQRACRRSCGMMNICIRRLQDKKTSSPKCRSKSTINLLTSGLTIITVQVTLNNRHVNNYVWKSTECSQALTTAWCWLEACDAGCEKDDDGCCCCWEAALAEDVGLSADAASSFVHPVHAIMLAFSYSRVSIRGRGVGSSSNSCNTPCSKYTIYSMEVWNILGNPGTNNVCFTKRCLYGTFKINSGKGSCTYYYACTGDTRLL